MKISKPEEQALRLVMRMAGDPGQTTLTELATRERLPEPTVAKLLGRLREGGVVVVQRGRNGGYALSRPAAEITVAAVIRALGRPLLEGGRCSPADSIDPDCPHAADCGLRSVWRHVAQRIRDVLESTSVADLTQEESAVSARLIQRLEPVDSHRAPEGVTTS